jgi:hypothetical protein
MFELLELHVSGSTISLESTMEKNSSLPREWEGYISMAKKILGGSTIGLKTWNYLNRMFQVQQPLWSLLWRRTLPWQERGLFLYGW